MKKNELKNFKIERRADRIKIIIDADETMIENWKFNLMNPTYITITMEPIPKGLLRAKTAKTKITKSIYYTRKETAFILKTVVLRKNLIPCGEKSSKILEQIYDMGVNNRSLYSRVILEKNEDGIFLPKTICLAGDTSTGILYYL